ncbi:hypothetical protein SAMN05428988_3255 [Chitinophaga sp. YR573]|uniref:hypothetical protein n=1 Tax=Chitinophaga sp. YR573 TaxID=1881040 RepID=UPI0008B34F7B|nr:hypothetical protein [Chitinophaga sp. YR573]SEW21837.1 hypothetical protein SAMN05428988_3255 [Chitinophaga sp. YR573]
MIQGRQRTELTLDTIFEHVSEYDIFRHYLGHDFKLGKPFRSPLRHKDDNPSASIIKTKFGRLYFTDFGPGGFRGKIIDFLRNIYPGSNFNDILHQIDNDLNLGITNGKAPSKPIRRTITDQVGYTDDYQSFKLIQVTPKPFCSEDFKFWGMYHLDKSDLKKEPVVYRVGALYIDKIKIEIGSNELVYGFLFEGGKWKIYRPLAENKKDKWRCNVPHDQLYGIKSLNPSKGAFQIKAVKDFKVASKFYDNCYGIQYEGNNVIGEADMKYLLTFPWILICNDPDEAGKKATEYYTSLNNKFKPFIIPSSYITPPIRKDLADIARHYGPGTVERIIIKNIETL